MKIYENRWFGEFECLCGDCPQTCCRGWVIPLSDRDMDRFAKERGMLGLRLFFATGGRIRSKFNPDSGKCPFLRKDGLCQLQREKGHDFIPWTCQSYPRFYRNYGSFEERCLDLSCPGAAQLFVKNRGALDVTEYEADPETRQCSTNDDEEYLEFLIRQRKRMTQLIRKGLTPDLADAVFLYAVKLQDLFAKGMTGDHEELSFDNFYEKETDRKKLSFSYPLSPEVLREFLASSLNHIRLKKVYPRLFSMFKSASEYLNMYGAGNASWRKHTEDFLKAEPFVAEIMGYYLSYYLWQYYLRSYETYSFRRQTALGLCHMNMVLLLIMSGGGSGKITEESIAATIAAYNRRAYFNDDILDEMYRIYEKNYAIILKTGRRDKTEDQEV